MCSDGVPPETGLGNTDLHKDKHDCFTIAYYT